MKKSIAIIGGGPSSSALATFLALDGHHVTIFDDGKLPNLIVGESLIPALMGNHGIWKINPESLAIR